MSKTAFHTLSVLLEKYFHSWMTVHRNASKNTLSSYSYAWQMFLLFLTDSKKYSLSKISLSDVNADNILAFLSYLENSRGISISSRNQRLAAFKSFSHFVMFERPAESAQFQRILDIPNKKHMKKVLGYLTKEEMKSLLDTCNQNTEIGYRNYVLLLYMYNTGARVSETTGLCVKDINSDHVIIHGKGNKDRKIPIEKNTRKSLLHLLALYGELSADGFVFKNRDKTPITRSGIRYILDSIVKKASKTNPSLKEKHITPHTLRHTTAMHMLQAGVDLETIRMWLGHVSIETTHGYIEADIDMKRNALIKSGVFECVSIGKWSPSDEVKAFANSLLTKY